MTSRPSAEPRDRSSKTSEARPTGARLASIGRGIGSCRADLRIIALLLPLLLMWLPRTAAAAQILPPDADWLTFDTPRFRVTYMVGLDEIARRAAHHAEEAHALLREEFLDPPAARIELVIADNVDFANGSAGIIPRPRVVVYVQPPASDSHLAFHDEWLELLILHELVHIFHLENAGGVWPMLRRVLGRETILYPQIFAPNWVTEGLATYIESAHTGAGRVRGTTFEMFLRTAVLEDAFFSIDRATIDPVAWPAGNTRYVYGALFIDHLARRFGPGAVSEFVSRVGRQLVPYRLERAAGAAFGTTLEEAWREWEDSLRTAYSAVESDLRQQGLTEPEVLTRGGRLAGYPRALPDGSIVYAAATGRDEAGLFRIAPDGTERRLAPISTLGPVARPPGNERFLFAQIEFAGPHRLFSDLYAVTRNGSIERVTRGGRVWEPDVSREGEVVVVASAEGTNVLALVDPSTGAVAPLTPRELEVYWSAPRWSPDGRYIAAARWEGGSFDIVLLDRSGLVVRRLTADRAVDANPSWSPDGRYLLFASDRTGISNLYAFDLDTETLLQVTNVVSGAFQPEVTHDSRSILFAYYRADGYYIARIPYEPHSWTAASPVRPGLFEEEVRRSTPTDRAVGGVRPYSPWSTLGPTRWSPLVADAGELGYGVGIATGGADVVERHVWGVEMLAYPRGRQMEFAGGYRYRGLGNPTLDLNVRQEWWVARSSQSGGGGSTATPALLRRQREAEATVSWVRRRWRSLSWGEIEAGVRRTDQMWSDPGFDGLPGRIGYPLDVGAGAGAGFSSVRAFTLSLGPQEGVSGSMRLQARRLLNPPADAAGNPDYLRFTSRTLFFSGLGDFGFAPPVLALRWEGGVETSRSTPGFTLGGGGRDASEASGDLDLLRGGTAFPVRGYSRGFQGGNRVVNGSAEYRFPIVLVERGFRLLPLAVNRLWGDFFVDGGAAWCPGNCRAEGTRVPRSPKPLVSVGAEGILDLRLGYFFDLPVRTGVALPLREVSRRSAQFYVRVGRSF